MKTIKMKLCQYPNNGFGNLNNNYYLLNQYGERFNIEINSSRDFDCFNVEIHDRTYYGDDMKDLMNTLKYVANIYVSKW